MDEPVKREEVLLKQAAQAFREERYSIAARIFYRLAKKKDHKAQNDLGICYALGLGMDQNDELAFKWFNCAVEDSNPQALFNLGRCYEIGMGVKKDRVRAKDLYEKAANKGCICAKYAFALISPNSNKSTGFLLASAENGIIDALYIVGRELLSKGSYAEAVEYLTKAADQGHTLAQDELGTCYLNGLGVAKDKNKALHYYRLSAHRNYSPAHAHFAEMIEHQALTLTMQNTICKHYTNAASNGYAPAMVKLSFCYENGFGVDVSKEKALLWLKKAAYLGEPSALYYLGLRYLKGELVDEDSSNGINLLKKSAEKHHAKACLALGDYYRKMSSFVKAFKYYLQAAYSDIPVAQYHVAKAYHNGKAIEKNEFLYYYWLCKAAEGEVFVAQKELAFLYLTKTEFSDYSPSKAIELLKITSKKPDMESALKLGMLLLEDGDGYSADIPTAINLLQNAAKAGIAEANLQLGLCYQNGIGVEVNINTAIEYIKRASFGGNARATAILANWLENGIGTAKDFEKALELLKDAAQKGDIPSIFEYGKKLYTNGNKKDGLEMIKDAAKKGMPEALFYLFELGKETRKDIESLTQLAEEGNFKAKEVLSHSLIHSFNYEDRKKAVEYLEENDTLQDRLLLADMYERGDGCDANPFRAFDLFAEQAATDANAAYKLGTFYEYGIVTDLDLSKAIHYYSIAAEAGNPKALWACAEYYIQGRAGEADIKKGIEYLVLLAEKGEAKAQFLLYKLLTENAELDIDNKSEYWFNIALENGYAKAQTIQGIRLLDTEDGKQQGFDFLCLAQSQEEVSSYFPLAECYKKGLGTVANSEKAFSFYLLAAVHGNSAAMLECASRYSEGNGTEQSNDDALYWYIQASLHGEEEAKLYIA